MVSRVVGEIMLIALVTGVLGFVSLGIILQQQALNEVLMRGNTIVPLSYVTCNASSILVYNYGLEDIEIREVYVNSTKTSFTLLVYDPVARTWTPSASILPRKLALIKVSSTLTSSTSITLITNKGVWSHTCNW